MTHRRSFDPLADPGPPTRIRRRGDGWPTHRARARRARRRLYTRRREAALTTPRKDTTP